MVSLKFHCYFFVVVFNQQRNVLSLIAMKIFNFTSIIFPFLETEFWLLLPYFQRNIHCFIFIRTKFRFFSLLLFYQQRTIHYYIFISNKFYLMSIAIVYYEQNVNGYFFFISNGIFSFLISKFVLAMEFPLLIFLF